MIPPHLCCSETGATPARVSGLGVAGELKLVPGDARPLSCPVRVVPDVPPDDDLVHPGRDTLAPVHGTL